MLEDANPDLLEHVLPIIDIGDEPSDMPCQDGMDTGVDRAEVIRVAGMKPLDIDASGLPPKSLA